MTAYAIKCVGICLTLIGFYGTWGRTIIDGTLYRLFTALHGPLQPFRLPGTASEPLLQSITGIYWPLDYLLQVLILFFWEAVDGSHPTTSAVALYFAGQHLSVSTAQHVDGYRIANAGKWSMSPTLWTTLYQLTAIAASGPIFLLKYFSTSSLITTPDSTSPSQYAHMNCAPARAVSLLPLTHALAYTAPLIMMSWRGGPTANKQLFIALWNVFPLTVALLQTLFLAAVSACGLIPKEGRDEFDQQRFLRSARITYAVSIFMSATVHIAVIGLSLSTVFFPMLFAPSYAQAFAPLRLLTPPVGTNKVETFGHGDLSFMKWDQVVGYSTMLVWASALLAKAFTIKGERLPHFAIIGSIALGCIAIGPGATVLAMQWVKDEMLYGCTVRKAEGRKL